MSVTTGFQLAVWAINFYEVSNTRAIYKSCLDQSCKRASF